MKYLIDEKVEFNPATGLLHLIGEETPAAQLSRPSTLLLMELIASNGKICSREELLANVWERNGLIPSGNNLSNHISYLRKTFRELGFSGDVIITVPREGFRLAIATRHSAPDSDPANSTTDTPHNEIKIALAATSGGEASAGCSFPLKNMVNICVMVSVLVLSISFISAYSPQNRTAVPTFPFPAIGLCKMYELNSAGESEWKAKHARLKAFIKDKKIECDRKKSTNYFEFYNFNPEEKNEQRALFFAQCVNGALSHEHCVNYLSFNLTQP